jgi:hemerythrin-like domain-containing protein
VTDPLDLLIAEHDVALAALDRLEEAALALRRGDAAEAHLATLAEVNLLLTGPVRRHNEKEEMALFPELGPDAPLGPFLEEHQTLWRLEQELGQAVTAPQPDRAARLALDIVDLLRAHIHRENEALFPLARERLGNAGLARVAARLMSAG